MIMSPFVNPLLTPLVTAGDADRLPALLESLAAPDPEEARIPISQYLWIVKRQRWKILGFCATAAIATLIISARLTPIFESTTTVDVDRRTPPGVVGPEAALIAVNDADQFLSTQMKLVQSDGVLRPVEERFGLRQREGQSAAKSARGEAAPIVLNRLRVTRPPNTYLMLISYRSDDPQLAADAANAIAQSYLEYSYDSRSCRPAATRPVEFAFICAHLRLLPRPGALRSPARQWRASCFHARPW
jgi:polysaccharide biosynthesis transport protein